MVLIRFKEEVHTKVLTQGDTGGPQTFFSGKEDEEDPKFKDQKERT